MLTYILLIAGFFALIKGADLLIAGGSSLARRFGVSSLVIGLTIIAFGTSAPELLVNVFASLSGNTEIAIGNVVGSNIANVLLALGLTAAFFPLVIQKSTVWKEIPFAFLASGLLVIVGSDTLIDKAAISAISAIDGIVFLSFFIIFIYYSFGAIKSSFLAEQDIKPELYSLPHSIFKVVAGISGLMLGGKIVVDSAEIIARSWGVTDAVIGLTVVAIGTSLPEIVTSVVAAYRKQADIAVGNIVGSSIFNVFFVLGISSIVKPLPFTSGLFVDGLIALFAMFLLFIFMFIGERHVLNRWQGISFVALYVFYISSLFI